MFYFTAVMSTTPYKGLQRNLVTPDSKSVVSKSVPADLFNDEDFDFDVSPSPISAIKETFGCVVKEHIPIVRQPEPHNRQQIFSDMHVGRPTTTGKVYTSDDNDWSSYYTYDPPPMCTPSPVQASVDILNNLFQRTDICDGSAVTHTSVYTNDSIEPRFRTLREAHILSIMQTPREQLLTSVKKEDIVNFLGVYEEYHIGDGVQRLGISVERIYLIICTYLYIVKNEISLMVNLLKN